MTTPRVGATINVADTQDRERLVALLSEYDDAKAAADEADSRLKAIKDGIKLFANEARPDASTVDIDTAGLTKTPLRVTWVPRWQLDTDKLKADYPMAYAICAKKTGRWELRSAPRGAV